MATWNRISSAVFALLLAPFGHRLAWFDLLLWPTLAGVLDHYAAGGRAHSKLTSEFIPGFILSDDEKAEVIAFLESLTDETVLKDPRLGPPR